MQKLDRHRRDTLFTANASKRGHTIWKGLEKKCVCDLCRIVCVCRSFKVPPYLIGSSL